MLTAQESLDSSRRQVINRIVLTGNFVCGRLFIVCIAILLMAPTPALLIYTAGIVLVGIGNNLTGWLLTRYPLWQAIIPLASALLLTLLIISVTFPDLRLVVIPFLTIVILLIRLGGDNRLVLPAVIVTALLSIAIIVMPPIPALTFNLGASQLIIQALSLGTFPFIIWIVLDLLLTLQDKSMTLAIQRANEAEQARASAESARAELEQRANEQARLLELVQVLEVPIIPVGQGVLVVPIVGTLDSRRIMTIQQSLLTTVAEQRAHTVVLDVTGITTLDTATAQALLHTTRAIRLLGAQPLLSGIRAPVAQTLVHLGVSFNELRSVANLSQALELAATA